MILIGYSVSQAHQKRRYCRRRRAGVSDIQRVSGHLQGRLTSDGLFEYQGKTYNSVSALAHACGVQPTVFALFALSLAFSLSLFLSACVSL